MFGDHIFAKVDRQFGVVIMMSNYKKPLPLLIGDNLVFLHSHVDMGGNMLLLHSESARIF
jgi:hypothetical protein